MRAFVLNCRFYFLIDKFKRDRRHKGVAAPRGRDDIPLPRAAISHRPAQRRYMNFEVIFLNKRVGPDEFQKLAFADHFAMALDKRNQNIKRTAANAQCLAVFRQHSSRRN